MTSSPFPERWLVVEVATPADPHTTETLIDELSTLSGRGVEELPDRLVAYFVVDETEAPSSLRTIEDRLRAVTADAPIHVTHRWQAHEEWADLWRRGVVPKHITSRLVVSPTWERPELRPADLLISIDPGLAFGTAEHPTTRGCLRFLDGIVGKGQRVADIGTGSGILSVAAVLLGAGEVVAVDSDPWASAAARENAAANAVADRVEVVEMCVGPDFLPGRGLFDGIVSNLETKLLIPLLRGFRSGLRPEGWLVVSGVQLEEAEESILAAGSAGFSLVREDVEAGWWTGSFTV